MRPKCCRSACPGRRPDCAPLRFNSASAANSARCGRARRAAAHVRTRAAAANPRADSSVDNARSAVPFRGSLPFGRIRAALEWRSRTPRRANAAFSESARHRRSGRSLGGEHRTSRLAMRECIISAGIRASAPDNAPCRIVKTPGYTGAAKFAESAYSIPTGAYTSSATSAPTAAGSARCRKPASHSNTVPKSFVCTLGELQNCVPLCHSGCRNCVKYLTSIFSQTYYRSDIKDYNNICMYLVCQIK